MVRLGGMMTLAMMMVPLTAWAGQRATAEQLAAGAKVYASQKCTICHSIAGAGNKKLPLDGVGTKLSTDQIREWIVDPMAAAKKVNSTVKPVMKAYKLALADLDALVAYLKNLEKK